MDNKLKKRENIIYTITGSILLVIATICMSIFCYGASISGDEYFSMGFANNTKDFLFLSQGAIERYGTDGWMDGEFLHDWISVQPGEQFSIMSIHRNVRYDVHPPLYFMLLNAISSFFVDDVTLFPGYLINVISGMVICIFLFLISRRIFLNKWLAFVPPLFWISSNAASITMTYLRMYAPLCALCLVCLYLHICFLKKKETTRWLYFLLGLCTTIGTLTHYYFYLMMFVIFCITIVTLIYRKWLKNIVWYLVSLGIGEGISLLAYPYVIRHILFSERGTQVQENLANSDLHYYWNFFKQFMGTLNTYVFNNRVFSLFIWLLTLSGIAVICCWLNSKKSIQDNAESFFSNEYGRYNYVVILISAIGYFAILFKISYSSKWVYISPIFSLLGILTIGVFAFVINKITKKYYAYILLTICFVVMFRFNEERVLVSINENRKTAEHHEEVVKYSKNCDVLFFYKDWNNLYDNQILELMDFDQIRAISINELKTADYVTILDSRKENTNDLVIYLPDSLKNSEQIVNEISKKIGGKEWSLIADEDHAVYYIDM